jgi:hypothetical protein
MTGGYGGMGITKAQHKQSVHGLRRLLANVSGRQAQVQETRDRLKTAAEERLAVVEDAIARLAKLASKPRKPNRRAEGHYITMCAERVKLQRMLGKWRAHV